MIMSANTISTSIDDAIGQPLAMSLVNEHITELVALLKFEADTAFLVVHGRVYSFTEGIRDRCRRIATTSTISELIEAFPTFESSLEQGYIVFVFVLLLHYVNEIQLPKQRINRFCKGNFI